MRLKDCLESDVVVSPPFNRKSPGDSWVSAYKDKLIPEALYKFYVAAGYFSFNKCPEFLRDKQKLLFPHLEAAVDLIKLSFEEYQELIGLMKDYDKVSYTPIKEFIGEPFDKSAARKFNRYFQLLIINMYSILDCMAEVVAMILSWGDLGRAQFSSLVGEIKKDSQKGKNGVNSTIIQVEDQYIEDIKNIIKREILEEGNNGWYELFKLYRNKQSHFRRYSGISFHDKQWKFYHFLPRQWPYYFQQDISYVHEGTKTKQKLKEDISELIMEQDIFEYCDGLHKKIYKLTDHIFNLLTEVYNIKKDSRCKIKPALQKKVASLKRRYDFKHF